MRRVDKRRRPPRLQPRTSQFIFGERQNLARVLSLLRTTRLPARRRRQEEGLLRALIQLRTLELNSINLDWDLKVRRASSRRTSPAELSRLARALPRDDYYLARLLSDHPNTPPAVLAHLARHSYRAVRENVARHPRTPVSTLRKLARERRQPLWYLVAFNPSAPEKLRARLRQRIKRLGTRS